MNSTTIEIDENGLREAIAALVILSQPIDLRAVAVDLYAAVQADVDERFNTAPPVGSGGVVYGGAVWPALSRAYLAANPRREGGQLLRDTGELANSFQIGDADNVAKAEPRRIIFGSALPKARGLDSDRPILFVHDQLADTVLNVIAERVSESA